MKYTDGITGEEKIVSAQEETRILQERSAVTLDPPPVYVESHKAKIALLEAGLLEQANQAVAASNNEKLKLAWATAPGFSINSPGLNQIAQALGLTRSQVENLLREAQKVVV